MAKKSCGCDCEVTKASFSDIKQFVYDVADELECSIKEALDLIEAYYDGWVQEAYLDFGGTKGNPPNEEDDYDAEEDKYCGDEEDDESELGELVSEYFVTTDSKGRLPIKKALVDDLDIYQYPDDEKAPDGIMLAKDYDNEELYLCLGTDPEEFPQATDDRKLAICWYRKQVNVNDLFGPNASVCIRVYDNGVCKVTKE